MADYRYAVGTVARATITGTQVVSVADSFGSFPVAAVLLFTTFQTSNGFAANARYSLGFSDGSQQCSTQAFTDNDNSSTKFTRSHYSNLYVLAANTSAPTTLTDAAAVSALGVGSFTLNWLTNDGTPWDVHYIAFGGSALQAKVLTAFSPATPQSQAITGVGFQPTGVICLDALSVGDASWGVATIALAPLPSIGWSDGTNQGAVSGNSSGFPSATDSFRLQRTNATVVRIGGAPPRTQNVAASVTSLDADGFTLDWTAVSNDTGAGGADAPGIYALAIGGPALTAGTVDQGDASITGLTTPGLALFATFGHTASAVTEDTQLWTFGAVDQSNDIASIFVGNLNGADPSVATRDRQTTNIPTGVTPDIVPASSTVNAALTPSVGSTAITLTWSPDDSVARQVLYLVFEGTTAPPTPPTPFPPGPTISVPMRKLRRTSTFSTEKAWNFFQRFQLDFQPGGPRAGNDPIEICLRYSDDSGNTWSDELWQTVDAVGDYAAIAQWFQLGRGRDRVWEVSSTSEAMTVWLAAYLDVTPGRQN